MGYPDAAWARAMTIQEVILKAVSGEWHWFRAAEVLGWSPRTLRRWRERYEADGYAGLVDKRDYRPSRRRVPAGQVEQVLRLYRERYGGFNVRHFHQIARREHGVVQFRQAGVAGRRTRQDAPGAGPPSAPAGAAGVLGGVAPSGRERARVVRSGPDAAALSHCGLR